MIIGKKDGKIQNKKERKEENEELFFKDNFLMPIDVLKVKESKRTKKQKQLEKRKKMEEDAEKQKHQEDNDDNDDDEEDSDSDGDDEDSEEARMEAEKASKFFDSSVDTSSTSIEVFSQLNLSRPLLRGVASIGFVTPTPIQGRVIPIALAGRDVCAR